MSITEWGHTTQHVTDERDNEKELVKARNVILNGILCLIEPICYNTVRKIRIIVSHSFFYSPAKSSFMSPSGEWCIISLRELGKEVQSAAREWLRAGFHQDRVMGLFKGFTTQSTVYMNSKLGLSQ
jgi:hypothetical protein